MREQKAIYFAAQRGGNVERHSQTPNSLQLPADSDMTTHSLAAHPLIAAASSALRLDFVVQLRCMAEFASREVPECEPPQLPTASPEIAIARVSICVKNNFRSEPRRRISCAAPLSRDLGVPPISEKAEVEEAEAPRTLTAACLNTHEKIKR